MADVSESKSASVLHCCSLVWSIGALHANKVGYGFGETFGGHNFNDRYVTARKQGFELYSSFLKKRINLRVYYMLDSGDKDLPAIRTKRGLPTPQQTSP